MINQREDNQSIYHNLLILNTMIKIYKYNLKKIIKIK
jgi:hypothetical protein